MPAIKNHSKVCLSSSSLRRSVLPHWNSMCFISAWLLSIQRLSVDQNWKQNCSNLSPLKHEDVYIFQTSAFSSHNTDEPKKALKATVYRENYQYPSRASVLTHLLICFNLTPHTISAPLIILRVYGLKFCHLYNLSENFICIYQLCPLVS